MAKRKKPKRPKLPIGAYKAREQRIKRLKQSGISDYDLARYPDKYLGKLDRFVIRINRIDN